MSSAPALRVRPAEWQIVSDILRRHVAGLEVRAFGSRVRGTVKPYSDLDPAVISHRPLSTALRAALADDFSESDLPWKVDVVDWATTDDSFRRIIERDGIVVQPAAAKTE